MLIKVEIIVLAIIAVLSFITGVVINIIDIYHGKNIKKNSKSDIKGQYEEKLDEIIKENAVRDEAVLEGKTIVDINIPKIEELDNNVGIALTPLETEEPIVLEILEIEDANCAGTEYAYQMRWIRTDMKKRGLIKNPERGYWVINSWIDR